MTTYEEHCARIDAVMARIEPVQRSMNALAVASGSGNYRNVPRLSAEQERDALAAVDELLELSNQATARRAARPRPALALGVATSPPPAAPPPTQTSYGAMSFKERVRLNPKHRAELKADHERQLAALSQARAKATTYDEFKTITSKIEQLEGIR